MTAPRLTHSCWWTQAEDDILITAGSLDAAAKAIPHRSRKAVNNRIHFLRQRGRWPVLPPTEEVIKADPVIYVGASGIPAKKDKRGNYMPYLPTLHGTF